MEGALSPRERMLVSHAVRETMRMLGMAKKLYSRKETAEILDCSLRTVDNMIESGKIEVKRQGARVNVTAKSIEKYLKD